MIIELETRGANWKQLSMKTYPLLGTDCRNKNLEWQPFLGMFPGGLVRMNRFKRPLVFSIVFEFFAEQLPGMMPLFHQTHVISKMNIIRLY